MDTDDVLIPTDIERIARGPIATPDDAERKTPPDTPEGAPRGAKMRP